MNLVWTADEANSWCKDYLNLDVFSLKLTLRLNERRREVFLIPTKLNVLAINGTCDLRRSKKVMEWEGKGKKSDEIFFIIFIDVLINGARRFSAQKRKENRVFNIHVSSGKILPVILSIYLDNIFYSMHIFSFIFLTHQGMMVI